MVALTGSRGTPKRDGDRFGRMVAANARIWAGGVVVNNVTGYAQPGSTALNLVPLGIANQNADNSGGVDGAIRCEVEAGNFELFNSTGADLIGRADIGKDCFLVDDQTVAKTNGGGTRSIAGKVLAVSDTGLVWVAVGILHL